MSLYERFVSFIRGMGSVLDLFGRCYYLPASHRVSVLETLRRDWEVVISKSKE